MFPQNTTHSSVATSATCSFTRATRSSLQILIMEDPPAPASLSTLVRPCRRPARPDASGARRTAARTNQGGQGSGRGRVLHDQDLERAASRTCEGTGCGRRHAAVGGVLGEYGLAPLPVPCQLHRGRPHHSYRRRDDGPERARPGRLAGRPSVRRVAGPRHRAQPFAGAGQPLSDFGTQLEQFIFVVAVVLALLLALVTLVPWLTRYLPWRWNRLRRVRAAHRAIRTAPRIADAQVERALAMRAFARLDYSTLLEYTPDPFGDWAGGRHDRLARAELASEGLRP